MVDPQTLSAFSIFKELTISEKKTVSSYLKRKDYDAEEIVFSFADSGGKLYLIADGELMITRKINEDKEYTLATLGAGQYFGAISLIDGGKHSATVRTTKETVLLTMTKSNLDEISKEIPLLGIKILIPLIHSLAGFLREMDAKMIETVKYVSLSQL